jgi:uncharacterized protein
VKPNNPSRGRNRHPLRKVLERLIGIAYVGEWPAALAEHWPGPTVVREIRHARTLPAGEGPRCRVAFVSDLHLGPTTPTRIVARAAAIVRAARPDVLLLGGDYLFLDATPARLERLATAMAAMQCPVMLGVLGNHDLWTDDAAIVRTLERAGVRVLVNEAVRLPAPWSDVDVVGLDDPWSGVCDGQAGFARGDGAAFRIVLCHAPDGLLEAGRHPFDLYLCGHTHGGHVATPWGPIVLPRGRLCRLFPGGFATFEAKEVFVSRGVGHIGIPFRTFAEPDVLILDLERPASGATAGDRPVLPSFTP